MAFPGDRTWKMALTIPHENILGEIVNDGLFRKTHVDLPDEFLTLDGDQAPQDGGADIAASSDELGTVQIPCYVVRCALNATPANSRVEIWFRRQDVSDTSDTVIWLWWGSTTETPPAVTENYGRNDVFDGTTGSGSPVAAWGVYLLDEDPSDPTPCYKDATGNGHDADDMNTMSRVDVMDARGARTGVGDGRVAIDGTWTPGTADWAILWAGIPGSSLIVFNGSPWLNFWASGATEIDCTPFYAALPGRESTATTVILVRDGDVISFTSGAVSDSASGAASQSFSLVNGTLGSSEAADSAALMLLNTAVNQYWTRAWHDCLTAESTFWEVGTITAAAVQAVFTVSPIAVGSEVRYYEQPHPQAWTIDFAGLDVAEQDGTYFLFQVMGSGGASDHYAWFDLDDGSADPAVADRTGHEIDVATGDTDEDIAVAAATVLNAIADLTVTIVGTVVTVTNERDGELEPPADAAGAAATGAEVALVVVGGATAEEITGIEESTATAWGGTVSVTRPRSITIVIIRPGYEPIRLEGYVVQPASALVPVSQRVDLNYNNPA